MHQLTTSTQVNSHHPGEGSMEPWKQGLVAPQAAAGWVLCCR